MRYFKLLENGWGKFRKYKIYPGDTYIHSQSVTIQELYDSGIPLAIDWVEVTKEEYDKQKK